MAGCGGGGSSSQDAEPPASFSLSASVSGLTSIGLELLVNGSSVTVASGSSTVILATGLKAGTTYAVSVSSQPTGQFCSIASGTGTITSANVANVVVTCSTQYYTVGGTVSGLITSGLELVNGTDTVILNSGTTTFTLPASVANTSSYVVTVQTQPSGQSCAISSGSGTVNNANVTSVAVTCTSQLFSIGGNISGLGNNAGLVLANDSDIYGVPPNSNNFTMPTAVSYGGSYALTVQSNPTGMTCSASNSTGIMGAADVTNIVVVCSDLSYSIGGTISGLTQSGLILANGTDTLYVNAGATSYIFPTSIAHGGSYAVTVQTQPANQTCSVNNATGIMGSGAVTNAAITCATNTYTVGGSISGLTASGLVLANGTDTLTVSANATSFSMPAGVASGVTYNVVVQTKPFLQTCTVSNSSGTVGATVRNVRIACTAGATLTTLHLFDFSRDGADPRCSLIQARDGNLYGMTSAFGNNGVGYGTVFRMTSSGTLTVLHAFTSGSDGASPEGNLIEATDGNLYGMAGNGGSNSEGSVFQITPGGTFTTLHSFTGGSDGASPGGSLIQADDGSFYGMTNFGSIGYGTVFKITSNGTLTTLHEFAGGNNGEAPHGNLIRTSDGNLYGITVNGGNSNVGTVFELTASGTFTILHSFAGGSDGANPYGNLIQASDGNFYGMTIQGGVNGAGTVFKITPNGSLTTLHAFASGSDGGSPQGNLIQANDGNFYGTTSNGGSYVADAGTVFQITPSGTLTILYTFTRGTDGANPLGGVIQASDGSLYGTTNSFGAGYGTVFKLR